MQNPSAVAVVPEYGSPGARIEPAPLDNVHDPLEARLREVEAAASAVDFDAIAWFWIILFGVAVPVALIAYGWYAVGGR